ncbi:Crp/Fnr family transcriptional regulator [Albidovulum sediminicola]|uniref:Crp/Fnr family transcriptional regulator n=1 Tax=Albidovulum sediminicola TaxID=2984331 RepID=A0ABT2Z4V7_9RHOB|nr:Crp/Fnr family transcriptional regulator [Defluviimonas sp. WL0075]MCV2866175.1 Crp/Fnr family transcriptional regulator [Defluviimonas sp. WL0075]
MEDEVQADIEARANWRNWRAREMVFARGDKGNHLFVVLEGRLKLSILSPAGRELPIRVAAPGDLAGEIACFDGGLRSADAVAMEPVRAVVLSRADLRAIAARHPSLHEAMIAYLGALLRGTNDRPEALALRSLQERRARYILFAPDTQHASPTGAAPHLALNLTQATSACSSARAVRGSTVYFPSSARRCARWPRRWNDPLPGCSDPWAQIAGL